MALVMMLLVSLFSLLPRADLVLYAAMHIVCTSFAHLQKMRPLREEILYYLLQVLVIDWIKLCHGIRVGFRWTHGEHTSCPWYGGTDRSSDFQNFVS